MSIEMRARYALRMTEITPPAGLNWPAGEGHVVFKCNNNFIPISLFTSASSTSYDYLTVGVPVLWSIKQKPFAPNEVPPNYLNSALRGSMAGMSLSLVDLRDAEYSSGIYKLTRHIDDLWIQRRTIFYYLERIN
jgi:hypothetical protein